MKIIEVPLNKIAFACWVCRNSFHDIKKGAIFVRPDGIDYWVCQACTPNFKPPREDKFFTERDLWKLMKEVNAEKKRSK